MNQADGIFIFISLYKYLKQALLVISQAHRVLSPAYSTFALKFDWRAGVHFIKLLVVFLRVKTQQEGFLKTFSLAVSESSQTRTNWNAFIYLMTDRALTMLCISSFLILCLIKCCLFYLPHHTCTGDKRADRVK